ncbi:MAG: ribosome maturation factor RimM [Erysipelotrichaceae bacterium]|nr:ribosome maturation factor RimM [Erysipelotrichaceae bacterium]
MEYLRIGVIVNTFGIKGELKIKSFSDFDDERYTIGNEVLININGQYKPFIVDSYKVLKQMNIVSFKDYKDINLVENLKGLDIYVDRSKIKPLKKGEYYRFELVGLNVYDENDNYLGKVIRVEETGANTNLRIEKEDKTTFLVPNVKAFVKDVDLNLNKMIIKLIEGLI